MATTTRPDRPREYFANRLDQPDGESDYSEIPATTAADWQDAEVRLPPRLGARARVIRRELSRR